MNQHDRTFPLWQRCRRWGARHPALYYLAPLAAWIVFVTWGSLTTPDQLPSLDFDLADKLEHAATYAVLAILMLRGWTRGGAAGLDACLAIWAAAGGWGIYLEFLQRATGYRTFDLWDAAANGVGALAGLAFWLAVAARGRRAPRAIITESEEPHP